MVCDPKETILDILFNKPCFCKIYTAPYAHYNADVSRVQALKSVDSIIGVL